MYFLKQLLCMRKGSYLHGADTERKICVLVFSQLNGCPRTVGQSVHSFGDLDVMLIAANVALSL